MISRRLESLAKYVDKNDKIIDVGCDHALLDIYLVENNYVATLIASDLSKDALKQGKNNIKKHGLEDKIETRLGSGLTVLNQDDDIDTVIISGMGSRTMLSILDSIFIHNMKKLILQSNNDYEVLRSEVIKYGFIIQDEEYLVDKGQEYINIVFVRGDKLYSEKELSIGPKLMHDKAYLEKEYKRIKHLKQFVPKKKIVVRFRMTRDLLRIKILLKKVKK